MRKILFFLLIFACKKADEGAPKGPIELPDPRGQASCYVMDAEGVTCMDRSLVGVDPKTFVVLWFGGAKDANSVFHYYTKMDGADPSSFELLDGSYSKDKTHVYYEFRAIPDADPNTFVVKDYEIAQDKTAVYVRDARLTQPDSQTFSEVKGLGSTRLVFTDRNAVYCIIPSDVDWSWETRILTLDTRSIKAVFKLDYHDVLHEALTNGQLIFFSDCTIALGADLASFRKIPVPNEMSFFYDDNLGHVYFRGRVIPGANAAAFTPLSDFFSKDDLQAYYQEKPIPGADVASFTTVCRLYLPPANANLTSPRDTCGGYVGKDKNRVYDPDQMLRQR